MLIALTLVVIGIAATILVPKARTIFKDADQHKPDFTTVMVTYNNNSGFGGLV